LIIPPNPSSRHYADRRSAAAAVIRRPGCRLPSAVVIRRNPSAVCLLHSASVHFSIPILPHCGQVTTSGRWALNTGMADLQPAQRTRLTGLGVASPSACALSWFFMT